MTTDGTGRRERGIEFGELDGALVTQEYSTTTAEVLDDHGEHDADTTETSYESAEKVRGMVLNAVDDDAIGRKEYTDREHETREEEQRRGNESF